MPFLDLRIVSLYDVGTWSQIQIENFNPSEMNLSLNAGHRVSLCPIPNPPIS